LVANVQLFHRAPPSPHFAGRAENGETGLSPHVPLQLLHLRLDYQVYRFMGCDCHIERFHYTLKQGGTVERLQFEEAHSLKNALALYSIVAWRLLWLTYTARQQPQAPATELIAPLELRVLAEATQGTVSTAREAIRAIAQLGGFPTNPSAKEPGVKVLWRGLRRLEAMVEGWVLALQARPFMRQD
jgi:hypothetical protein